MGSEIDVRLTAHADEQIVARELDRELVIETARAPEQIVRSESKPPVAQSRISFKGQPALLRVAFRDEGNMRVIITAYPTSQIDRYWLEEPADET
jgi:hypothetical protein